MEIMDRGSPMICRITFNGFCLFGENELTICVVEWMNRKTDQKRSLFMIRLLIRERPFTSPHQLFKPSSGNPIEKIRSFKEFMSRMFSGTFGSIRSLNLKRAGSDLLFTCLPRYSCVPPFIGIESTVPGRTAACVIEKLR